MLRRCGLIVVLLLLSACATPVAEPPQSAQAQPTEAQAPARLQEWSGRISVQVQTEPPQHMNASFALQGSAQAGQLEVLSPLGTTVATLQWSPQEALLQQGREPQRFVSMAALTERVLGASLPMVEIFDWLQGQPTAALGWQTDISQRSVGWVFATRTSPAPTVLLKIKLDPP